MRLSIKFIMLSFFTFFFIKTNAQNVVENYKPLRIDSIKVGTGKQDFMPYIQEGYTLMTPENNTIRSVAIFLEDSGYDQRNNNSKEMYKEASDRGIAILSVSTQIPFDFYFSNSSIESAHIIIKDVFHTYKLPNENIFFLGASLVGHRALRYIKYMNENKDDFQLDVVGMVMCNFTLDWTRKWYQHERDMSINRINLWEPKFMNYMLETNLNGTPETALEKYHEFSAYSYFDKENRNIPMFKNYAVRAYIKPEIAYRLSKYYRTLYENNATDIVGFLAELRLLGNEKTELIDLTCNKNPAKDKNSQTTWDSIDKVELLNWMEKQMKQ